MDYNEEYNYFQSFLQPDEYILWHGTPSSGRMYNYGTFPVFVGIVWFLVSLTLTTVSFMSGNIIMILFSIPFLLIGFMMTFGEPIRNAKLKGKIFYAITDSRLLIREGNEIRIFTADMLTPMQIRMNKNGTGTIYFERTYYSNKNNSPYNWICALQNLSDVHKAQIALSAMLSGKKSKNS